VPDDDSVIEVAQVLDQHILKYWVKDPKLQQKPNPGFPSGGVRAQAGKEFTIQLANVADPLAVKSAQPRGHKLIILTGSRFAEGIFKFMAMGKGKTTVNFVAAHSKTLAITEGEVSVEVA
jgi:hypothetical protein